MALGIMALGKWNWVNCPDTVTHTLPSDLFSIKRIILHIIRIILHIIILQIALHRSTYSDRYHQQSLTIPKKRSQNNHFVHAENNVYSLFRCQTESIYKFPVQTKTECAFPVLTMCPFSLKMRIKNRVSFSHDNSSVNTFH